METIKAFKISDGRIFENELEAIDAENTIEFKRAITEFVVKKDVFRSDEVINFIIENAKELKTILNIKLYE